VLLVLHWVKGWGLSWPEAMATKTPVIMPRNTALVENITEDKGYLVDSGSKESLFTVIPHDNEIVRPLVDTDKLVETMLHVYNNQEEAKKKAETAYGWVTSELNWQGGIAKQWVELFDAVSEEHVAGVEADTPTGPNVLTAESF